MDFRAKKNEKVDLFKRIIIRPAHEIDLTAVHELLSECAKAMYEQYGLDNWYPFPDFNIYKNSIIECKIFCILDSEQLIGSFTVSTKPRPYYSKVFDITVQALYLGKLAIKPTLQGHGLGSRTIKQIEQMVLDAGYSTLRFDCIERHPFLSSFYTKLGYTKIGIVDLPPPTGRVICFEKTLKSD